jgi:hypothetical protein
MQQGRKSNAHDVHRNQPRKNQPNSFNNFGTINFKEDSKISLVQIELNQGEKGSTGSTNQHKIF